MPGHPDGQSYALWRGNALLSAQQTVTTVTPFALDAIVTNFASLMVHVQAAVNNGGTVIAQFYNDAGHTQFAGQFSWQLWNCDLQVTVPILGSYLHFTITTPNAGNQVFTCYLAPSNVAVTRPVYTAGFNQNEGLNVAVAAGVTSSFQLPDIVTGTVYLFANEKDAASKLVVFILELDATGASAGPLASVNLGTTQTLLSTACGERILQLGIFNSDGAAPHSLDYRIRTLSQ
jgi:hypothetical protein